MPQTIISRVGHCAFCEKAGRPHYDSTFAVIGRTGQYHMYIANRIGKIGYTPHFYRLIKTIGQNVVYEKSCAMHGCGVDIYFDNEVQDYQFILYEDSWQRGIMELKDWNALVQYKDPDYFI